MKRIVLPLAIVAALALAGCSGMNRTEQRTLSGGAIGAGVGTITAIATDGCVACGAVIGGVVGAAAGFVFDQVKKHDN
jgi:osmotically inducible lipoprotein OsmB